MKANMCTCECTHDPVLEVPCVLYQGQDCKKGGGGGGGVFAGHYGNIFYINLYSPFSRYACVCVVHICVYIVGKYDRQMQP